MAGGPTPRRTARYHEEVVHTFVTSLDHREDIKLVIKLPWWFKVETPIGEYNPDWAIVKEAEDGQQLLYLVRETKGTFDPDRLRGTEQLKIAFGKRHFRSLNVDFAVATDESQI